MCLNNRYVYNPYIHKRIYVPCGKCHECLQKKANTRRNRIRASLKDNEFFIFAHLTYNSDSVPYILKSDLDNANNVLPIYRNSSSRNFQGRVLVDNGRRVIDSVVLDSDAIDAYQKKPSFAPLCTKAYRSYREFDEERMGVIYYQDLKRFFKRFRQNLERHFAESYKIKYFACAEYGETYFRPHFHLLVSCPSIYRYDDFRSAIVESWPYASADITKNNIEPARDAASYCASYVNSSTLLPEILKAPAFRQKHSYSKYFGLDAAGFSLPSLLEKLDNNDLSYNLAVNKDGAKTVYNLPLPQYVINRRFPIFKGYSRLSDSEKRSIVLQPSSIIYSERYDEIEYTPADLHKIAVSLDNAYDRYHAVTGKSRYDYAHDFVRIWNTRKSNILRRFYENVDHIPIYEMYDNIVEAQLGYVRTDIEIGEIEINPNPNSYRFRIEQNEYYTDLFNKRQKGKQVTNLTRTQMGHFV